MPICHPAKDPLSKDKPTIVLVGNPNSGKTTLFNSLTGLRQHTANFPGTTVTLAKGAISLYGKSFDLIDAPGTYSLTPFADDEAVTRDILADNCHAAVIIVVDPAHLLRALAFAIELAAHELPLGIFVNVTRGLPVSPQLTEKIEQLLGVPAICADASRPNAQQQFAQLFSQTKATKSRVLPDFATATARLRFVRTNFAEFTIDAYTASRGIDRLMLHPLLGLPIFLAIMWSMFELTYTLGAYPAGWLDSLIVSLGDWVRIAFSDSLFARIFVDGLLGGVGATIVFVPQITLLFTFMAMLEQSGYLARVAYLLEGVMKRCGLHGRSAVPLLMGFGCNVPAIMAIRTLPTHREKVTTALMLPFMSCSARLPVLTLLVGAFVATAWQGTTLFALYAGGVLASFITSLLLRRTLQGKPRALLLELPAYRLPRVQSLLLAAWGAVKHFLRRAGKILVPLAIILWVLFSYPTGVPIEESYAGRVGHAIAPVFAPLGFDWRTTTGLIAGVAAKEVYVAAIGTLYALEDTADQNTLVSHLTADSALDPATIAALLTFIVLYTPCIAVIATLKSELNLWWAMFGAIYPTVFAWLAAFVVRELFLALTSI